MYGLTLGLIKVTLLERAILAELEQSSPASPGSAGQSTQATCTKGNQCSKEIFLFFFFFFLSQNYFGTLNFHQCKYISLFCSEANWYRVPPLSCYSVTSRLILAPKKGASELTLVLAVLLQAGRAWARHRERGQGGSPVLTLICIPGPVDDNTDLLHQLPLLAQQRKGHKNQCRWGAWTHDFKEEAISPGPSFCISPPLISNNSIEQHLFRNYRVLKTVEGLMW